MYESSSGPFVGPTVGSTEGPLIGVGFVGAGPTSLTVGSTALSAGATLSQNRRYSSGEKTGPPPPVPESVPGALGPPGVIEPVSTNSSPPGAFAPTTVIIRRLVPRP